MAKKTITTIATISKYQLQAVYLATNLYFFPYHYLIIYYYTNNIQQISPVKHLVITPV